MSGKKRGEQLGWVGKPTDKGVHPPTSGAAFEPIVVSKPGMAAITEGLRRLGLSEGGGKP